MGIGLTTDTLMSFTATFKFRTSRGLVKRADRVRRLRHKSQSEIGREMLLAYVEAKEIELGLVTVTAAPPPPPTSNGPEVSHVEQSQPQEQAA